MTLENQQINIEQWLKENNYSLPSDPNDYPLEAIVPFYKAVIWKEQGYTPIGEVITHDDETFGAFWQKMIITSKKIINNQPQSHIDISKFADKLYDNLERALSYIEVCIQACMEDVSKTHNLSIVLEDVKKFLLNILGIFDQLNLTDNLCEESDEAIST